MVKTRLVPMVSLRAFEESSENMAFPIGFIATTALGLRRLDSEGSSARACNGYDKVSKCVDLVSVIRKTIFAMNGCIER